MDNSMRWVEISLSGLEWGLGLVCATGIRGSNIVGSFSAEGAHSGVRCNTLGNYAMWYGSGLTDVQALRIRHQVNTPAC